MNNNQNEQNPPEQDLTMTMFGNPVTPLEVYFVSSSSTSINPEDLMPPGMNEAQQTNYFRYVRALRPRGSPPMFDAKHPNNRFVPRVEPTFKRKAFPEGTLISIKMERVLREDVRVEIEDRTLTVTGLVRTPPNTANVEGSTETAVEGARKKPHVIYTYKTGVTEIIDLTATLAGHREDYVDVFLHPAEPPEENQLEAQD